MIFYSAHTQTDSERPWHFVACIFRSLVENEAQ